MNALQACVAVWITCAIGAPAVALAPANLRARLFAALVAVEGALLGVAGWSALGGTGFAVQLWAIGPLGHLQLAFDRLAGVFAMTSAAVLVATAPFAAAETGTVVIPAARGAYMALYQLLVAAVLLVLTAADVISLMIGWELMSLLIYAVLGCAGRVTHRASYLMLALGEAGTLAALVGLLLIAGDAAGLDFAQLRASGSGLTPALHTAAVLLAFFGFGVKSGVVPFNQWLVPAYSTAPRGFTPVLAGVTTGIGVYAVVRVAFDLAGPGTVLAGGVVLVTGATSALVGILYATIQVDLRRTLAHSSIEHMGIVFAGIGAALIFASAGQPPLAAMALVAALYHLVNHALFKALLFVGSGAVERTAGSGNLDRLGGLVHTMPVTSALILCGVLAITALPPLNGFVSEWLTLQSLLRAAVLASTPTKVVFALSGAALALSAGLAMTCFAKFYAMAFLGMARSSGAAHASEPPPSTRAGLAALALACLLLGVLPTVVIPALGGAIEPLAGDDAVAALVPPFFDPAAASDGRLSRGFLAEFDRLGAQVGHQLPVDGLVVLHRGTTAAPVVFAMSTSYAAVVLAGLIALVWGAFAFAGRGRSMRRRRVWDGGLRELRAHNTYTATGFSNPVRVVFEAILSPRQQQDTTRAVAEHFRTAVRIERAEVHLVDRLVLDPVVAVITGLGNLARRMHGGRVNAYAAYVLLMLLVVLTAVGVG